jgi:hypothetical protein
VTLGVACRLTDDIIGLSRRRPIRDLAPTGPEWIAECWRVSPIRSLDFMPLARLRSKPSRRPACLRRLHHHQSGALSRQFPRTPAAPACGLTGRAETRCAKP